MKKLNYHKKQKKPKKKFSISNMVLVGILLAGICVMLYPTVSNWWNQRHASRAITAYQEAVEEMSQEEIDAIFAQADEYNAKLRELEFPFTQYTQLDDLYYNTLNVNGDGIIGYIEIQSIDVNLPVYHGTADNVLDIAAGHWEGSSLPVGGESTHAVISAHRGLPSALLFTNLDKLTEGDTFTVTVLDRTVTYMVDQILIVEPTQLEAMRMEEGMDYCTLQTCTPYGINTHRLLVRGRRVENIPEENTVKGEATRLPNYIVVPAIAIPILFVLLLILLIKYRRKK